MENENIISYIGIILFIILGLIPPLVQSSGFLINSSTSGGMFSVDNLGVVRIQDDCLYSAYGGACQLTSGDCDYRSIGCEGNYGASEFLIKNGTNVQMFSRDNGFACSDGEIFQNRAGAIGGLCAEDNSFVVNDSTGEPVFCIKSDNGTWYAKSAIYASVVVS